MRKALTIIINSLYYIFFLFCFAVAWAVIGGYLEMMTPANILMGWPATILAAAAILSAILVVFIYPIKQYHWTVGKEAALLLLKRKNEAGNCPAAKLLRKVFIIMLISAYAVWGLSSIIFAIMIRAKEKDLKKMGISLDWKSHYPAYDTVNNAAPLLTKAMENIKGEGSETISTIHSEIFRELNENPGLINKHKNKIENIVINNKSALKILDETLQKDKLVWSDYRNVALDTIFKVKIPNYIGVQNIMKLKMMETLYYADIGDKNKVEKTLNDASILLNLHSQDPMLIGAMIYVVNNGIVNNVLAVLSKLNKADYIYSVDKNKQMGKAVDVCLKGMTTELIGISAYSKYISDYSLPLLPITYIKIRNINRLNSGIDSKPSISQSLGEYLFFSTTYSFWSKWDYYCFLKGDIKTINYLRETIVGNKTDSLATDLNKYIKINMRATSLLYGIAVPNYISMIDRAIESDSKNNATAIFMAAMDYKRDKGYYPTSMNMLIPKYFDTLPKDPINQKEYGYKAYGTKMKVYSLGKDGNDDNGLDDDKFAELLSVELYPPTGLSEALALAQKLNKNIILCFLSEKNWDNDSKELDNFLINNSPMKEIIDRNYVYYKVDAGSGVPTYELSKKYVKGLHHKSMPHYVILDGKGNMLQTSDMDKTGNIGMPHSDEEIAHFLNMIKKTSTASKKELDSIYNQLRTNKRGPRRSRR